MVQLALVVADVVLIAATMWYASGPTLQPVRSLPGGLDASTVAIVFWWASPSLAHFAHRSWAGTAVSGAALLGASAIGLVTMYTSDHSTAGIGFLTIPVLRWLLAIGVALGAWAISRIRFP